MTVPIFFLRSKYLCQNEKREPTLVFVSFSVKSNSGISFSVFASTTKVYFPKVSCEHATVPGEVCFMFAFRVHPSCLQPQIHVFLNHNVGKMWSRAVSGPLFATVILMRMSLGVFFAYSAVMSQ